MRWPTFEIETLRPVSVAGSGLPLVILVVIAFALPWLLARRQTRSHIEVAVAVWASAGVTLVAGAGMFAWVYADNGADVRGAWAERPVATFLYFLRPSLMAVLAWGPVLGLSWYVMAQRVEKRRGEDMMRRGEDVARNELEKD